MLIAAKSHCYGFLLHRFVEAIEHADPELKPILTKIATLYALYNLLEVVGTYALQSGFYSPAQFALIRSQVPVYCKIVRQDANPLVDSFGLSDFIINSPLGRYDGDIYRHYFEKVKRARKDTIASLFHIRDSLTLSVLFFSSSFHCNASWSGRARPIFREPHQASLQQEAGGRGMKRQPEKKTNKTKQKTMSN